jgi:hypothetical protein
MDPELPHGGYWRPVEKSDERSQQGSPRDWEYRLLRRLEREDSRPWLQETGCRPRGAWVVDEREGRRRGEERRRSERERRERGRCPQSQRRSELRQSDDDTQPELGGRAACRLWWSAIHLALAPVANQWGSHATSQCAPGQCKHSEQARSSTHSVPDGVRCPSVATPHVPHTHHVPTTCVRRPCAQTPVHPSAALLTAAGWCCW